MYILHDWHRSSRGIREQQPRKIERIAIIALIAGCGPAGVLRAEPPLPAQAAAQKSPDVAPNEASTEDRLRTLERERDDLKKRNADLEQRLRQLQTTVDNLVHEAVGEPPSTQSPALLPAMGMVPRRGFGPFMTQFRPMFPPFNGMPDTVELAIAFSDAIGERDAARPAIAAARNKAQSGRGGSDADVNLATAQLLRADRKVRLLRNIIRTARNVAADDAERMRKLGAVRAVSTADVRNANARLNMLDEILAADSEQETKPTNTPKPTEPK
jgi:cell division septum initiation protein DivIVA